MIVPSNLTALLAVFAATASALTPPQYPGFRGRWSDHFDAAANAPANPTKWNVISTNKVYNNELEVYTSNVANQRHTGAGRFQLIPRKDKSAPNGWTSGRIESKYTFTPQPGSITRVESQMRIGGVSPGNKQGMWPAFWLLGQSLRQGGLWPDTGEIDIFENVNGNNIAVGSVHCDKAPGGICNEHTGLRGTTTIDTYSWVTWRVEFDLRNSNWQQQSINWYKNGVRFHTIAGSRINNQNIWKKLTAQPLYIIFNVAVGGFWPGPPNANTWDGTGNVLEMGYVAHYTST